MLTTSVDCDLYTPIITPWSMEGSHTYFDALRTLVTLVTGWVPTCLKLLSNPNSESDLLSQNDAVTHDKLPIGKFSIYQ